MEWIVFLRLKYNQQFLHEKSKLLACQEFSMEEDVDAEKALKAPPISNETVLVIVCAVDSV